MCTFKAYVSNLEFQTTVYILTAPLTLTRHQQSRCTSYSIMKETKRCKFKKITSLFCSLEN